jgi:hypothetical protein
VRAGKRWRERENEPRKEEAIVVFRSVTSEANDVFWIEHTTVAKGSAATLPQDERGAWQREQF